MLISYILVSENARLLLANLLQGSRSTLSCVSFPRVFAFQAGMWGTPISTLLNSPTVSARFRYTRLEAVRYPQKMQQNLF
jgi:hypothetical protein